MYIILVFFGIPRKDKYVIQVYHHVFVENVSEDTVHETLESSGSVGEAEVHDEEIEGAVAGSEGGLPFITGSDADKVVSSTEVDLGEDV